jgi:RNA ligase (TIGR02306 family)
MAERKLATIQEIARLDPIPQKDRIELATVMGWTVIVKKGDFQVGDQCVFFEIDSLLPDKEDEKYNPAWAFMEKTKWRVKTMKMAGCLSQGLVLPVSIIPGWTGLPTGEEVTDLLGVRKWMPPQAEEGFRATHANMRAPFPHWVPKTDEIRLQSALACLEELKGKPYYITVKLDGCSATYTGHPAYDGYHVCSRSRSIYQEGVNDTEGDAVHNIWWRMSEKYNLEQVVKHSGFRYAFQGEVCGPGVQGNRLQLDEPDLFIFDIWDVHKQQYVEYPFSWIMCESHNLQTVPLLEEGDSFNYTLEELIEMAKGFYPNGHPREGIVVRPKIPFYSTTLKDRMSFKVVNNDFLLKVGE